MLATIYVHNHHKNLYVYTSLNNAFINVPAVKRTLFFNEAKPGIVM